MDGGRIGLEASDPVGLEPDGSPHIDKAHDLNANKGKSPPTVGELNLCEGSIGDHTHFPNPKSANAENQASRDGPALRSPLPEAARLNEPNAEEDTAKLPIVKEENVSAVENGNSASVPPACDSTETRTRKQVCGDLYRTENTQPEGMTESPSKGEMKKGLTEYVELSQPGDLPKIVVHRPTEDVMVDAPGLVVTAVSKTTGDEQDIGSSTPYSNYTIQAPHEDFTRENPANGSLNNPRNEAESRDVAGAGLPIQLQPEGAIQSGGAGNSNSTVESAEEIDSVALDKRIEETVKELHTVPFEGQTHATATGSGAQPTAELAKEIVGNAAEKQVHEDLTENLHTTQPVSAESALKDDCLRTASCETDLPKRPVSEAVKEEVDERVNVGGVNGGTFTAITFTATTPETSSSVADGRGHGNQVAVPASHEIKQQGVDDHQDPVYQRNSGTSLSKGVAQSAKKGEKKKQRKVEAQKQGDQTIHQNPRNPAPPKDKHPATDASPFTSTTSTIIDKQQTVRTESKNKSAEGDMDTVNRRGVHSSRSRGKRSLPSQTSAVTLPTLGTLPYPHPQSADMSLSGIGRGRGHLEDRTTNAATYEVIPGNRRHKGFQPQEVLAKSKQLQENSSTNLTIETKPNVPTQSSITAQLNNTLQQKPTVQLQENVSNGSAKPSTALSVVAPVRTPTQPKTSDGKRKIPLQYSPTTASVKGSQQAWESNVVEAPSPDTATLMAKYNSKPEPRIDFNRIPQYNFKQYSQTQQPPLPIYNSGIENPKPSTPKVSFNTGTMDPPAKPANNTVSSAASGHADRNYVPPHLRKLATNNHDSASTGNITGKNGSSSYANITSNPKQGNGVSDGLVITQAKPKRQSPWKVDPPSPTTSLPQRESTPVSSGTIDLNAPMESVSMPKKRQTLNYEERLAGWDGNWAPAPLDWDYRPAYDNNSKKKVRAVEAWAQGRADDAINNPIEINTKKNGFRSGDEPASGLEDLDAPIAKEEHDTILPDDPQTLLQRDVTVQDIVDKKLSEAKARKNEAKEVRRAYREHNRQIDREFKDKPVVNPRAPNADIYIRPATKLDLPTITNIYNFYIKNSIVTPELVELNETQWLNRWEDIEEENLAFLVAVLRNPKGTDNNRRGRRQPDPVVGFAYAEEYGNLKSAFKYTCEIQFFVRNNFLKQGIGKTLVDRMIGSMDPGYNSWMATDFLAEDRLRYELGGKRPIRSILIQLPYNAKDDTGMQWKKTWLDKEWEFKLVGTLPGVAIKLGKL